MKNDFTSFRLFVRPDERSIQIADTIRKINSEAKNPLEETENGRFVIAIGGDGTFIDAVTTTQFAKNYLYTGIHTGTLGFLQDLSANDIFSLIQYIHFESELKTRKVYISLAKVILEDSTEMTFYSLNEVMVVGENYSKISFAEYINGELLQNVSGNGIVIATATGDTAYSLNSNGAIDFSRNFQLVCTLETPIHNAALERFITNPIICSKINVIPKPAKNICIIIDGIRKDIPSEKIANIEVTMQECNYIHKLDLFDFSKVSVVRNKILGY